MGFPKCNRIPDAQFLRRENGRGRAERLAEHDDSMPWPVLFDPIDGRRHIVPRAETEIVDFARGIAVCPQSDRQNGATGRGR